MKPDKDMIGVFWEKAQERGVPMLHTVVLIEETEGNPQRIQEACVKYVGVRSHVETRFWKS
jgi:hypothetical protein